MSAFSKHHRKTIDLLVKLGVSPLISKEVFIHTGILVDAESSNHKTEFGFSLMKPTASFFSEITPVSTPLKIDMMKVLTSGKEYREVINFLEDKFTHEYSYHPKIFSLRFSTNRNRNFDYKKIIFIGNILAMDVVIQMKSNGEIIITDCFFRSIPSHKKATLIRTLQNIHQDLFCCDRLLAEEAFYGTIAVQGETNHLFFS